MTDFAADPVRPNLRMVQEDLGLALPTIGMSLSALDHSVVFGIYSGTWR